MTTGLPVCLVWVKKTAERLIIEMRDRLKEWQTSTTSTSESNGRSRVTISDPSDEAVSALIALGYKPQEASKYVLAVAGEDMSSEDIIRDALKASVKK